MALCTAAISVANRRPALRRLSGNLEIRLKLLPTKLFTFTLLEQRKPSKLKIQNALLLHSYACADHAKNVQKTFKYKLSHVNLTRTVNTILSLANVLSTQLFLVMFIIIICQEHRKPLQKNKTKTRRTCVFLVVYLILMHFKSFFVCAIIFRKITALLTSCVINI